MKVVILYTIPFGLNLWRTIYQVASRKLTYKIWQIKEKKAMGGIRTHAIILKRITLKEHQRKQ